MKYRILSFLCLLIVLRFVSLSLTSCDDLFDPLNPLSKYTLSDFNFGYVSEANKFQKLMGMAQDQFIAFNNIEEYERLIEMGYMKPEDIERNEVEFRKDDYQFHIKAVPEMGVIDEITVTSSADSIIRVKDIGPGFCTVEFGDYGDVDLKVSVKGGEKFYQKTFQLRVVGTVDVKFRITAFWLRAMTTRIRLAMKGIPEKLDDIVLAIKDSVTVVGYCEYYDHNKYGYQAQFLRDTLTFPTRDHTVLYIKGKSVLLRDITDAVREFESRRQPGTRLQKEIMSSGDLYYPVEHEYSWHAEQVHLHWLPVCDNPFIRFTHTVNSKKTFDHLVEDEEGWTSDEDDAEVSVDVTDDELSDEDDKETLQYFNIAPLMLLSQSQRDSLIRDIENKKKEHNYDKTLSDHDRDSLMNVIYEKEKEADEKEKEEQNNENQQNSFQAAGAPRRFLRLFRL